MENLNREIREKPERRRMSRGGAEARGQNLNLDRIYGMKGIREMNDLKSVAKRVVYSETFCDAAKLRVLSWDSQGPPV
jgi:hypothetical protein